MILNDRIPYDLSPRKLPGIMPFDMGDWLHVDEAYGGQMALRRDLLNTQRDDVLMLDAQAVDAAHELLDLALDHAPSGITVDGDQIRCPDGHVAQLDRQDPLGTLGQVFQEDFCILQDGGDEHLLSGAVLCFPAAWTLRQKFMRPLTAIHVPVPEYEGDLARRVQRLFHGIRAGRPLWRFNALRYDCPDLHQPHTEEDPRPVGTPTAPYLRSERQCLIRLPQSGAVVFSIHTYVVKAAQAQI
jgi:hypothetical protein